MAGEGEVVNSGHQLLKLPLVVHRTTARRQLGRDIAIAKISVRVTPSNPPEGHSIVAPIVAPSHGL